MREKTELVRDIEHAKQEEAIVNHPLFIASLKSLEDLTIEKFKSLEFNEEHKMLECNIRLKLIEEFEQNLLTIISNGNAAFNSLEDIQEFEKAVKR